MTTRIERAGVTLALFLTAAGLMAGIGWRDGTGMPPAFAPEFFPRIVLWLLLGLTALGFLAEVFRGAPGTGPGTGPATGDHSAWRLLRVAVIILAMLVFAWAMMRFGFFLTGAGFSILALPLLGLRNPLVILAFAIGVPGALVGLFNHLLTMPLPTSPFSYMF